MDATLKLSNSTLAFGDPNTSNNPRRRFVDWSTDVCVSVTDPKSVPHTLMPGESLPLFSGTRTTTIANDTEWTLTLSPLDPSRYRFTTSAGTLPTLRTDRGMNLATQAVTVSVNANQTATVAATVGSFSFAVPGDTLFIPGMTTGDTTGPFNTINEGVWTVLSVSSNGATMQIDRPGTFAAFGETVTVTNNSQFLIFSAAGVQVGDGVGISSGFNAPVLGNFKVLAVTPSWFEVSSTLSLPISAVAVPGAAGIMFYSSAKRYIEVYVDQEAVLRLNGDTTNGNGISPWQAGDQSQMGHLSKSGLVYSAVIINMSLQPMNVQFISAE